MEGVFRFDSRLYRTVEKLVNLVKLNFLWILFSLPVVTVGAANCALHETADRLASGVEGYITSTFWEAFRKNLKRAVLQTLPMLAAGMAICADFLFWKQMTGTFAEVMKGLVMAVGAVYLFLSVYFYPLLDRMDTGFLVTLRNAGLLAFKYLPRTLYMVLWIGIVWIAGKIWAAGLLLTLLLGGSGLAFLHSMVLRKIFVKEGICEE